MSKIKHPRQKKSLSLERDRRNTYGENSKSSRKNIPRAKQRSHMDERRSVAQVLERLKGDVTEDAAYAAESETKLRTADSRNRSFKKVADTPLGIVLERNRLKRAKRPSKQ